ncbi:Uncharacterised protein [Staphylococcus epidermidis]|uniref:hypothetical protein n=1 Tax=Staphylococcus epidermidis TaxID=1282 RepID=UPI000E08C25C|nr:hypothetical protein [Staphylococcus epidermidis]SUM53517.1 Uncharacterised protein [Staphylococcus epidermidis]SUM53522.1 Uncharacterised protein [Staphylococcus epidermidis]
MANTKTQKKLTIAKKKSKFILDWFINEVPLKKLNEKISLSKTTNFRYKKQLIELEKEYGAFYALSEVFTLNQINALIELYNDFVEHPEKYDKRKKSKGIDMEDQAKIVNKHLSDMNMHYSEDNNREEKPLSENLKEFWKGKL